ncbi:MAG: recombinase family protein [Phycisphaerae bacterium]|nr:recombinase family protein [Phycisphaerae bacterium]
MKKTKTQKQAVGYCRVSSVGQKNNGTGLDRQEQLIKQYARQNGYKLVNIFNEAFTGTENERPIFTRMLAELLTNGCRVIIVERLDRLARDLAVQLQLVGLLSSKGLTLISADTQQDVTAAFSGDPMMKAMIQVQGVFAELDKSILVNKLRKAREEKKKRTGRCEGRKPFGFYPGEEKVIKRIKQLYRKPREEKRLGFYQIATILNKEGWPTRNAKEWHGKHVRLIIERAKAGK